MFILHSPTPVRLGGLLQAFIKCLMCRLCDPRPEGNRYRNFALILKALLVEKERGATGHDFCRIGVTFLVILRG